MAFIYQRKTLVPLADVGPPGPLPADLVGLQDVSLADLEAAVGVDACTELGYLNTGFFPAGAPPVFGDVVSPVQLRIAAETLGFLASLEAAAGTLPQDDQIRFGYGVGFFRLQPVVVALGAAAGLTSTDLDDLFNLAVTINPL